MPSAVRRTALVGQSQSSRDRLAKNLGYLSLALGVAEILAPRLLSNAAGIRGRETLVRAYGAREIATGVAILTSHNPQPWIWARVAGDVADIATVATGERQDNTRNIAALAALGAVAALDLACARALGTEKGSRTTAIADYSDRSGFPKGIEAARGAARNSAEQAKTRRASTRGLW